ncbi:uncharacterized protein CDAR_607191 [Caerostris darwini]|uniref:Uncharacterized protein n=1 Tax=Caerostris darwini TaxID=1538125 RepID=A0AAV4NI41_9ARAC|nr:uncharacterized protein CDAR_607191 [Caerostris darwini]
MCNNLALSLRVTGNNITKIVNVCLILSVTIPFGLTVFGALAIKESSREYQMFYSFFSILENGGCAFVLIEGFIILMTYSALLILPALMTILCGTVYYKVSDLFKGLENKGLSDVIIWESGFRLVLGSLIIIAIVLCASRISFQIRRFRSILQIIHNGLLRNEDSTFKTLQLIRTMMNMEFPRMTAGGVLDLEPVLILSVFGSVLTYVSRESIFNFVGFIQFRRSSTMACCAMKRKPLKTLQFTRTMMNMEISPTTAGGVLDLKPVLIPLMFGSVLSYGLFVLNITQN